MLKNIAYSAFKDRSWLLLLLIVWGAATHGLEGDRIEDSGFEAHDIEANGIEVRDDIDAEVTEAYSAEIYKWVDKRGVTHYSDERRSEGDAPAQALLSQDEGTEGEVFPSEEQGGQFQLPQLNILSSAELNDFPNLSEKPGDAKAGSRAGGRAVLIGRSRSENRENYGSSGEEPAVTTGYGFPYRYSSPYYSPYNYGEGIYQGKDYRGVRSYPQGHYRSRPPLRYGHKFERRSTHPSNCPPQMDCRALTGGLDQQGKGKKAHRMPGVKVPKIR